MIIQNTKDEYYLPFKELLPNVALFLHRTKMCTSSKFIQKDQEISEFDGDSK